MLTIETSPPGPAVHWVYEFSEGLVFSPDGQTLALDSWRRGISIWDQTTGISHGTIATPRHDIFSTMAYSPDRRFLAYVFSNLNNNRIVGLWDVALQAVRSLYEDRTYIPPYHSIVRFSPNGESLALVSWYATPKLLDTRKMVVRKTRGGRSWAYGIISFSPSGRLLASATGDGIFLYEERKATPVNSLKLY